jgi:hypothetical protein
MDTTFYKILIKDCLGNILYLSKDDSLKLELLLNKSQYKIEWKSIGDKLYSFYIKNICDRELIVSSYQLTYLINLFYNNLY